MIVFGVGANNQVTNSKDANGTWLSINMCWGIGVLIGVYCSEGGSGANLKHARALRYQNLNSIDPSRETTQSSFSTYPSDSISDYTAFYTEGIGTAMVLLGIYAITDQRNGRPRGRCSVRLLPHDHDPGKDDTGTAVNPARDLGSRVFTTVAGWGSKVFSTRSCIPLVADSLGVVSGAGTLLVNGATERQRIERLLLS
ncbi:hypothetical protein PF010_g25689 [Phytophthora fragariae]|uniref:Aquaporin n=1 Tax=Phytophthora fragariae TaxID=53985 RepID=A0A6G0JYY9_9STRA|nr:hypothetical protein PF010_g25689 [Phytophthora fragariae]